MNLKKWITGLMTIMGLHSSAQQGQPTVLPIPPEIDPVKVMLESQANALVCQLDRDSKADPAALLNLVRQELKLDSFATAELDMQIVSSVDRGAYTIHNLTFQSMPGLYVPANLYVPKGKGPFPAILNSHGHWPPGRRSEVIQRTAQILASNGYVCLCIDAMGSGERGRGHEHEYHGANLGSALLDLGKPLMGVQLFENSRALDLLCSLPYVDKEKIGATGASGGGNQTMWLAAVDPRVRAAVPVVSVGTFRAYIMNSNCVCELHPNGLLHFEEGQLLQAMAPKAIKIMTALKDANAAFNVQQMLKSYRIAKLAYQQQGVADRIDYELFDEPHSYTAEMNASMVRWFDRAFGRDAQKKVDVNVFNLLDTNLLSVFKYGVKKEKIQTIPQFIEQEYRQAEQRIASDMKTRTDYQKELQQLLSAVAPDSLLDIRSLEPAGGWQRLLLETSAQQLIPVLFRAPREKGKTIHVLFPAAGKQQVPEEEISRLTANGAGLALVDLYGLGERSSASGDRIDAALPRFHTVSRSLIWIGRTMLGTWANEISLVNGYLHQAYGESPLRVIADRETALAALISGGLSSTAQELVLEGLPLSYLPPEVGALDSYNMAIHVPGILSWGDIPMLLALNEGPVSLHALRNLSGEKCTASQISGLQDKVNAYKRKFNNEGSLQIN